MIDASQEFGRGDQFVLDKIKDNNIPVILVLNKIDYLTNHDIILKIDAYKDIYPFADIVPVSALKGNNTKELINVIKKYLKDEYKYYEDGEYTNKPITFTISEIIREKAFELTEQEVPHSLTVIVEDMEKKKDSYHIIASIIVDRDSLKRILIGKQGSMIKNIGMRSRKELEALLGKTVYLETYVRVIPKWRDKEKYLQEFGFNDFE